ncbi:DNA-protecting protein DprA [Lancefieldella sp. Marseille-Q7238]|uniref:DNA-processing protein DprA n=1 Tax=Lancefieldella sp. Marseille-Q7238 TaxID=3022127 RepID=UPI0024A9456F|nr:DNA-protecting protein DprA [Lancefieldella sp. Marseille-Q7238]
MAEKWAFERGSKHYPACLEDLENPPDVLYGIGNSEIFETPMLSIVGARRATPYGIALAEMAARVAADCGVTVVSGGAMGCDCAAGMSALAAGGKTIAVLGCGADVVYPRSSKSLFSAAVKEGAVISLDSWGTPPRRFAFPRRNAVIAALGSVLVVTEAGVCSGTMSTAETAEDLGRKVYAIPGSIFSPTSAGTNKLITDGARIIPDEASLALSLALDFGATVLKQEDKTSPKSRVMSALTASPCRPEELAMRLGENVLTLMRTLTDFEAQRIVQRLPDGRYTPTREYHLGLVQTANMNEQRTL